MYMIHQPSPKFGTARVSGADASACVKRIKITDTRLDTDWLYKPEIANLNFSGWLGAPTSVSSPHWTVSHRRAAGAKPKSILRSRPALPRWLGGRSSKSVEFSEKEVTSIPPVVGNDFARRLAQRNTRHRGNIPLEVQHRWIQTIEDQLYGPLSSQPWTECLPLYASSGRPSQLEQRWRQIALSEEKHLVVKDFESTTLLVPRVWSTVKRLHMTHTKLRMSAAERERLRIEELTRAEMEFIQSFQTAALELKFVSCNEWDKALHCFLDCTRKMVEGVVTPQILGLEFALKCLDAEELQNELRCQLPEMELGCRLIATAMILHTKNPAVNDDFFNLWQRLDGMQGFVMTRRDDESHEMQLRSPVWKDDFPTEAEWKEQEAPLVADVDLMSEYILDWWRRVMTWKKLFFWSTNTSLVGFDMWIEKASLFGNFYVKNRNADEWKKFRIRFPGHCMRLDGSAVCGAAGHGMPFHIEKVWGIWW